MYPEVKEYIDKIEKILRENTDIEEIEPSLLNDIEHVLIDTLKMQHKEIRNEMANIINDLDIYGMDNSEIITVINEQKTYINAYYDMFYKYKHSDLIFNSNRLYHFQKLMSNFGIQICYPDINKITHDTKKIKKKVNKNLNVSQLPNNFLTTKGEAIWDHRQQHISSNTTIRFIKSRQVNKNTP